MKLNYITATPIQFSQLKMSLSGISEALIDIAGCRPSTSHDPIQVVNDGNKPLLVDGYHRVVQAMLLGKSYLPAILVDKTGWYPSQGAFRIDTTQPLLGLERLIDDLDDDQLQQLTVFRQQYST